MAVQALSIVVKVQPGKEDQLRSVLKEVGADPLRNPYIRLGDGKSTHLANWVIVNDPDNGPRLFFASNHDGDRDSYIKELIAVGPGLDAIFGCCEGYTGVQGFPAFVKANSYKSQTFFASWPTETVQTVLAKISLRRQLETLLNTQPNADAVSAGALAEFFATLKVTVVPPLIRPLAQAWARFKKGLHDWFWGVMLAFAKWWGGLRINNHYIGVASNLNQSLAQGDLSDANHMTNLIDVKFGFRLILRLSLWFMQQLALHAFRPGQLAGVTTIKFARWILVDGGKRMLFQSRFDGTWENYMGDFVDKIAWGLDSIWGNCNDYPSAGMKDIDAFKRFIRSRQFEHLAIYEAYPIETVLNLGRDRDLAALLTNCADPLDTLGWFQLG
jgi:hypothetical protein